MADRKMGGGREDGWMVLGMDPDSTSQNSFDSDLPLSKWEEGGAVDVSREEVSTIESQIVQLRRAVARLKEEQLGASFDGACSDCRHAASQLHWHRLMCSGLCHSRERDTIGEDHPSA